MDKRIREGIEACRPASDDLSMPQLADVARGVQDDPQARLVYERVQQFDAAILKSIDDVEVSPGLADRILECLRAAQDGSTNGHSNELLAATVAAASEPFEATPTAEVAPVRRRLALSRRNVTGAALTMLLACVLVVVMIKLLQDPGESTIVDLADQWQAGLNGNWQNVAKAPSGFDVPSAVLLAPVGWQWIDRYSVDPVVAYQLHHPKGGKAMLYVARMTRNGLPSVPPLEPQSSSGKAIAYWQSGSRLYVLVVDDERDYRDFVHASTTPFA